MYKLQPWICLPGAICQPFGNGICHLPLMVLSLPNGKPHLATPLPKGKMSSEHFYEDLFPRSTFLPLSTITLLIHWTLFQAFPDKILASKELEMRSISLSVSHLRVSYPRQVNQGFQLASWDIQTILSRTTHCCGHDLPGSRWVKKNI